MTGPTASRKDADFRLQAEGRRWLFTFAATGAKEFQTSAIRELGYRRTLMIRLVPGNRCPLPPGLPR